MTLWSAWLAFRVMTLLKLMELSTHPTASVSAAGRNTRWTGWKVFFFRVDILKPPMTKILRILNHYHWFLEKIFADDIPRCEKCNSLVKPGRRSFESASFFFYFIEMLLRVSSISLCVPSFLSFRYCLLWGESSCSFLHFCKICEYGLYTVLHIWRDMAKINLLSLSVRTSLVVISSSSWEHLCRSNHLPVLSAGMTDLYRCYQ